MKYGISFLLLISIPLLGRAENQNIQLQKIFHHRLVADNTALTHIELAKIVFYFNEEPVIKVSNQVAEKKDQHEMIFFIPRVQITSDEAKTMVEQLNKSTSQMYSVALRAVQKPAPGIEVKFTYNPQKVIITYDLFDAITKAKSVEFRILNKALLDALKQKKDQNVLRTSYHQKPTIIIDCGHGGKDTGTISKNGVAEKDVALSIGLQLGTQLADSGYKVVYTRKDDRFIPLDERTYRANLVCDNAILISLHANNCARPEVQGLETFCLASNLFNKKNTGLETAIDIMVQERDEHRHKQSEKLAHCVHTAILDILEQNSYKSSDRKVRHAATQVLLGIRCPGILIETDYLSGPNAQRLSDPFVQKLYAQGICRGIRNCF